MKCCQTFAAVAYVAVIIALTFLFKESLILLGLLFAANFVFVNYGGIFAIRAFVFPFSVWLIRDGVEGQNIVRYQTDFANLLDKSFIILKLLSTSSSQPQSNHYQT